MRFDLRLPTWASCAAIAAALVLSAPSAHAGGFAVNEQSVLGLGRAYSGETSSGDDASSLWYNPALSAFQDAPIVTTGVSGIFSDGALTERGTTIQGPGTGGLPLPTGGPDSDEPLDPAAVPHLSAIYPVRPGLALGLSVNAPFGLVVDHPRDFFGRFDSTRTELTTINTQASVAWAITPSLAIGVGANAQYAEAVLENALPNLAPGAGDAAALTIKGDDWSYGWNVGAAWRPHERLSLGAHYRSAIEHELEGRLSISGLEPPLDAINDERSGLARLETPAIAAVGVSYRASPDWTVHAQGEWWQWSNFDEIRVTSPNAADLVTAQNYRDSRSLAVGADRRINDRWTWRAGVKLEESPTQAEFRSTRVPDSDRLWLTTGATWRPTERASVDVGLAYVTLKETRVSRSDLLYEGTPAASRVDLEAEIDGDAVIFGLGGSYRF